MISALAGLLLLYVAWICFEMTSNPAAPGGALIVVGAIGGAALALAAAIMWRRS